MNTPGRRIPALSIAVVTALLGAAVAACGGGGGGSSSNTPPNNPPSLDVLFTTFQSASLVIGQPDFTTGTSGSAVTASNLYQPYGGPVIAGGTLWVADLNHNRVLGFPGGVPAANGASATIALGQEDLVSGSAATGQRVLRWPQDVATAGGKLAVADYGNNRVLVWNAVPTTTGAPADVAVGQPDFLTANVTGCSSVAISSPQALAFVGEKLIVADSLHNRVLVWNQVPTTNRGPADLVVGQPDLTTCSSGSGASKLNIPNGVWSDGTRLVVSDYLNHRVLVWNTFPTTSGQAADVVLGHGSLSGYQANDGGAASASTLNHPSGVDSNGRQLFVADRGNHRVLVWSTFPTTSGQAADVVLGQGSFSNTAAKDDDQNGSSDSSASARTFADPTGVRLIGTRLFVTELGNNRVVVFDGH